MLMCAYHMCRWNSRFVNLGLSIIFYIYTEASSLLCKLVTLISVSIISLTK